MEHKIDLNLLRIFHLVAAKGSLTQASLALNCPKSKISRDLTKLEDMFELNLLNRSPRGIKLTPEGQKLIEATQGALELLTQGVGQFQNLKKDTLHGEITITAPEDISIEFFPELIAHFNRKYPEIIINLYTTNDRLSFDRYNIDLALRVGKLQDSNLIQKKVGDIRIVKVCATKYQLTNQVSASLYNFDGNPLIEVEGDYTSHLKTNSFIYLKQYTLKSPVESFLPEFICRKELENKELVELPYSGKVKSKSLYLLSRPQRFVPEHVKVFKNYLETELKQIINPES